MAREAEHIENVERVEYLIHKYRDTNNDWWAAKAALFAIERDIELPPILEQWIRWHLMEVVYTQFTDKLPKGAFGVTRRSLRSGREQENREHYLRELWILRRITTLSLEECAEHVATARSDDPNLPTYCSSTILKWWSHNDGAYWRKCEDEPEGTLEEKRDFIAEYGIPAGFLAQE